MPHIFAGKKLHVLLQIVAFMNYRTLKSGSACQSSSSGTKQVHTLCAFTKPGTGNPVDVIVFIFKCYLFYI